MELISADDDLGKANLNTAVEDKVAGWPSLGMFKNVTAPLLPLKAVVAVVRIVLGMKLFRYELMR